MPNNHFTPFLYRTAVTILMICAVAVSGTVFPGIFSNTIDLAPNFSGKIFEI